jgi:CheY-like chemotaxis protein
MAKILVVEDNPNNTEILTRFLVIKKHTVLTAADGPQALTLAGPEKPDLIIMDMGLPGMDGWEVTRRLKEDPATRHIPIVACTASAMPHEVDKAREAGCSDFEPKPIDFARLLGKLNRLLTP